MTLQIEVKDDFADEIIKVLKSFKNKIISINSNEFDINMQKSIDDLKNKRVKKFNINEFLKDEILEKKVKRIVNKYKFVNRNDFVELKL